jgi:glycosyltransferase involved in cell wall biosynthesis
VSEPDAGQGDAINKGFKRIKGDIVAWLNSDDIYRLGAVRRAVSVLQAHPEVGLVYSDVDSIDTQGEMFNRMTYGDYQLADLMAFNIIGQASVFFRRSLLERVGYLDTSYQFLLDHHLWLRMALFMNMKYVPGEVWAAARIHSGAKNVADASKFGEEAYRLVEWMLRDDRFQPYIKGRVNRMWAGAHRLNGFYLLDGGERCAALRSYWRGFWRYPPAVLKDWRRIAFALSPIPLDKMRARYLGRRKSSYQKEEK